MVRLPGLLARLGVRLARAVISPMRPLGPRSRCASHSETTAATVVLLFSECVPGMRATVRLGRVPNGSLGDLWAAYLTACPPCDSLRRFGKERRKA